MINTKIYKSVYTLAEKLMEADKHDDQAAFERLYSELKLLCIDNENTPKDHPEQWETLADFTEDLKEALVVYEKALGKAIAINSKDHMSSIAFSMASLQIELGQTESAIESLKSAQTSANKIEDKDLKKEIDTLLKTVLGT